jgi:hypothetical protein
MSRPADPWSAQHAGARDEYYAPQSCTENARSCREGHVRTTMGRFTRPAGGVTCQLSWGLRAHVVYRVLARHHPAAPGAVRRRALNITKPGPAAAGGPAGGSQPAPVCIGSACRSSVQVSGRDRWDGASSGRPRAGEAMAANKSVLKLSPGRGRPPTGPARPRARTCR